MTIKIYDILFLKDLDTFNVKLGLSDINEQKLGWIKIALSDIEYVVGTERYLSAWTYVGIGLGASIIILAISSKKESKQRYYSSSLVGKW